MSAAEHGATAPTPARAEALARELLQEAVYRSRGEQAGASLLRVPRSGAAGNCGLGERAAVVLDLTPRAEEAFEELFPGGLRPEALERLRGELRRWVERQDALDRRRNHFLKDFRGTHGFDRSLYDADTLTAFEAGLDRINGAARAELDGAARALLAAATG